jgi:gluconate 2-dehydrogenase gamma chain
MTTLTRRSFVAASSAAALLPIAASPADTAADSRTEPAAGYQFFNQDEARFVESACARLIPADAAGPGALEAGAPLYLDAQLAGPWGTGDRLHRSGDWQAGSPALACTPALFVRTALHALDLELQQRGTSFHLMPPDAQDAFLGALRRGDANLGVWSRGFFDLMLQLTVEGFFSAPRRGLPRDRIPWRLSGFPGAFATRS